MTFNQAQTTMIEYSQNAYIASDEMLMSSSLIRRAQQVMVHTQLVRALVRFDVYWEVTDPNFELVSVAVWNVPLRTALWNSDHNDFRYHTEYFTSVSNIDLDFPGITEHRGLLYAFENSVTGSYMGDTFTTCLIIGVRDWNFPPNVAHQFPNGRVTYHRVNVNEAGAQLLRRNFVYRVTITGVRNAGENTQRDAWSGATSWLDINVRNWQDGAGSAVMFDGEDILAVGGNRIDFTGDGTPDCSITPDAKGRITSSMIEAALGGKKLEELPSGLLIGSVWMTSGYSSTKLSETILPWVNGQGLTVQEYNDAKTQENAFLTIVTDYQNAVSEAANLPQTPVTQYNTLENGGPGVPGTDQIAPGITAADRDNILNTPIPAIPMPNFGGELFDLSKNPAWLDAVKQANDTYRSAVNTAADSFRSDFDSISDAYQKAIGKA